MWNKHLFVKEVQENKWIILAGLICLIAVAAASAFLFDLVAWTLPEMESYFSNMPQWLQGHLEGMERYADYDYAAWANWNPKNLVQIGSLMAILLGMSAFASEIKNKTITFLLSNNISRQVVFITKVLAGGLMLFVIMMLPTLFLPLLSRAAGHALSSYRIIGASLITFAGVFITYSMAVAFSVLIQDRVKAGIATLGGVIALGILGYVPWIGALSPYKYIYGAPYVFGIAGFPWGTLAVLLIVNWCLLWLCLRLFVVEDL